VTGPDDYSEVRFLEAKGTVDNRALHRPTLDAFVDALADAAAEGDDPVRLLEVGAGTGTMLRRLLERDRLPDRVAYTGVDLDGDAVARARETLPDRAREHGYEVDAGDGTSPVGDPEDPIVLRRGDERIAAAVREADVFSLAAATDRTWDAVVACAFLDLVELEPALSTLFGLAPGGPAYFPITFDGETLFRPVPDPDRDRRVREAYHATMDAPDRPGGSRTGRRLFDAVPERGGEVVAAGGSDWVVTPDGDGYPADEAYFLHYIVDTVEGAVDALPAGEVADWAARRHGGIAAGEVTYLAHQVDVLARAPE